MDGMTNTSPNAQPASAGQQEQFDMILGRARQVMEDAGEQWISALKADPMMAAVRMGTSTVRQMATMSEKAGQPVDPMVLFHVGVQFCKDIASVALAAGAIQENEVEAFLKDSMAQSIMEYLKLDAKDGLISGKDKQQAQGMLAQMQGSPVEPGDGPGPDNMAPHEQAETPAVEQQEGAEEDSTQGADDPEMAAELAALRQRKGGK
jgi:hypothetical protein